MAQLYFLKSIMVGSSLLAASPAPAASLPPPDSLASPARPRALLLKAGLRLTHLRYSHDSKSWQFLLPLSLGAEYRVAPRLSLATLLETDMLASATSGRRRSSQASALAAVAASLGVRYYYGHAAPGALATGRYLALEGSADWAQVTATALAASRRRGTTSAALTPGVFVLWGVQHRTRPHCWYDLNAGAGVLAPSYYNYERPGPASRWNLGGQLNIRLFFGS